MLSILRKGWVPLKVSPLKPLEVHSSPVIDLARRLRLGPEGVTRETFPLPKLRSKLEAIAGDLHNGIGFSVLRGLDPAKYSVLDNVLLYLGVTSYIAEKRGCQDSSGNMISEKTAGYHQKLIGFSTYQRYRT
jgi:hypothetical protein